jgi:SAM-dependent methyltransferase
VNIVPNKSNKDLADIEFSGESYCMACPICADLRVGKVRRSGEYTLYHCSACDVVFAHPMKTSLSVYEDSFDYRLRNELTIDPLQWERRWDIEEFMKSSFRKKRSLLDIGCGTGFFVRRIRDAGLTAYGIDFDKAAIESGKEHFGLEHLFAADIKGLRRVCPELKVDIVTMFQVIEHVEDPNGLFLQIREILKPGGVVALSLPSRDRWPDVLGDGDTPPHHLTMWSGRAICSFLERHGFRITKYRIEGFPVSTMTALIYPVILKIAPFLTVKGQKMGQDISRLSDKERVKILKKSKKKKVIANILGVPLWVLLRFAGARGPDQYIEAACRES